MTVASEMIEELGRMSGHFGEKHIASYANDMQCRQTCQISYIAGNSEGGSMHLLQAIVQSPNLGITHTLNPDSPLYHNLWTGT